MNKILIILLFSTFTIINCERIVYYTQQQDDEAHTPFSIYRYIQEGGQIEKELLVTSGGALRSIVQISDRYLFYSDLQSAGVIDLKIKRKFYIWRNMGARFYYDSLSSANTAYQETAVYEKGGEIVYVRYGNTSLIQYNLKTLEVIKGNTIVPMSRIKGLQESVPGYGNRRFLQKFLDNQSSNFQQSDKSSSRNLSSSTINLNTSPNFPNDRVLIDSTLIEYNRIFQITQNKVFYTKIGDFLNQSIQHSDLQYRCLLNYDGLPIAIADTAIIKFVKYDPSQVNDSIYQHFYNNQITAINYGIIKNKGCFRIGSNGYFLSSQGMVKVDLTNLSTSVIGGTQQDFTTLTSDQGSIINSYGYTPYEHIPISGGKWVLLASIINPRSDYSIQFASRTGVSTENFKHQTNQKRTDFSAHLTLSVNTPNVEGSVSGTFSHKAFNEIKTMSSDAINSSEFKALTFQISRGISQFIWRYEIEGSGMFDGYTLSTPQIHVTNTPLPPIDN